MDEEQDKRAQLLRLWHEYGKAYNVFVPAEQPDPHDWDRPLPQAYEDCRGKKAGDTVQPEIRSKR